MVAHPRPLIEVLAAMPDFRHHRGNRHSLTAIQAALIPFESVPPSPAHQPAGPAAAVWRPALAAQGGGGWPTAGAGCWEAPAGGRADRRTARRGRSG